MKVTARIVAPDPPPPQTLADLPDGVLARVMYCGIVSHRWRDFDGHVLGLSGGLTGHPRHQHDDPSLYTVVEIIGPLEMEFHD